MWWMELLAQTTTTTSSSGTLDEVLGRIVAWLCGIFIVWMGLVILFTRRMRERRRREQEGLPPLPPLQVSIREWFAGLFQSSPASSESTPRNPSSALDDLLAELPVNDDSVVDDEFDIHALLRGSSTRAEYNAPALASDVPVVEGILEHEEEPAPPSAVPSSIAADMAPPPVAQTRVTPPPPQLIPDDAIEVLQVWRNMDDGSLIIQMKEVIFTRMEQITDGKVAHRYLNLVHQMMNIGNIQAGTAPPAPVLRSAPVARPDEKATSPVADDMGIAGQIEEFLQHRLIGHPAFQQRMIHIHPAKGGGVQIEVDGNLYDAVGDIEDPDIRAFLGKTIEDWSNQS